MDTTLTRHGQSTLIQSGQSTLTPVMNGDC